MNLPLRYLPILPLLAFSAPSVMAQAPEASEDVMLQGFYWDSQQATGWTQLTEFAAEIGQSFTCIWLPPSASPEWGGDVVGGQNVGYHPREWNNQNSCWGTAESLKGLTSALHQHGVKVIADVVVNHRAGATGWGDFTQDNFGVYGNYQLTSDHICNNDEMNTDASSGSWYGLAKGARDTGENWGGARDLDHTSSYVQEDCKAYLNWMKGEYGYDGWRYDFCKGFSGEYVGIYNDASQPFLSVGEYWDGSYDAVAAWIDKTGKKSMAFDFPMKYAALNNGLAKGDYAAMSWIEDNTTWRPAGMIHHHKYNRYSVTFVDNHDSYKDGNKYLGNIGQAYAFILSAPGVPCVFWVHWRGLQKNIEAQIAARRLAGIHSQSDCEVKVRSGYYESHTQGKNGTLICRIGAKAPATAPAGYTEVCGVANSWHYYLPSDLASLSETPTQEVAISLFGRMLEIASPSVTSVKVVSIDGQVVMQEQTASLCQELSPGLYVVSAGDVVKKIIVR